MSVRVRGWILLAAVLIAARFLLWAVAWELLPGAR